MTRWFIPNPASVSPGVLAAQVTPPGAGSRVEPSVLSERLREFFFPAAQSAVFFSCLREGMLQTAVEWFSDKKILMIINGPMSQEWYDIADDSRADVTIFDSAYGASVDVNAFRIAVRKEKFDLLMFVGTDAYMGTRLNPESVSREFRAASPEGLIITDISGSVLCGTDSEDIRNADICVFGSGMALGLPPGLGTAVLTERAHTRVLAHNMMNGRYFNYSRQTVSRSVSALDVTPYTLLNALSEQIDTVLTEGMEARVARLTAVRNRIHEWVISRGFTILSAPETRALNCTAIELPAGLSAGEMVVFAARYGVFITTGTGLMPKNSLILYHGNDTRPEDAGVLVRVLDRFLSDYDTRRRQSFRSQRAKPETDIHPRG